MSFDTIMAAGQCVCVSHSGQDWEEVNISTNSHFSHLSLDALPKNYRFHVSNTVAYAPQKHCRGLNDKASLSDFSLMSDLIMRQEFGGKLNTPQNR